MYNEGKNKHQVFTYMGPDVLFLFGYSGGGGGVGVVEVWVAHK